MILRSYGKSIILSLLILLGAVGTAYADRDNWNAVVTNNTTSSLRININGVEQNVFPGADMHANELGIAKSFSVQVGKQTGQPAFKYTFEFRFKVQCADTSIKDEPGCWYPQITFVTSTQEIANNDDKKNVVTIDGDEQLKLTAYVDGEGTMKFDITDRK